ncbi:response regulator transcription factor [Raineyella fluvialis]|uniref:Response regulator n=1 Tax=Raineyella fluvialis TaxID=2662261 RepID=A0A5Q2F920_9ACTN|nr:response regulator transcription factor [Raineyella fluvialis]QGF23178.1 response regulator [Raineyella fluvialis]
MTEVAAVLRVVIADDSYLVREGTRRLLEDSGRVEVVAAVADGEELLAAVRTTRPDVVITDIRMPPGHATEGIAAAHAIRAEFPRIGVVVLSQYSDADYAVELFAQGTAGLGYLLKAAVGDLDDLLRALVEVAKGGSVVDPGVVERLVDQRAVQAESPLRRLGPRELDVLREMAEGRTNAAIGAALHLSESTIEKHVNTIFNSLGLSEEPGTSRRVAAVLSYLRNMSMSPAQDRPGAPR